MLAPEMSTRMAILHSTYLTVGKQYPLQLT